MSILYNLAESFLYYKFDNCIIHYWDIWEQEKIIMKFVKTALRFCNIKEIYKKNRNNFKS